MASISPISNLTIAPAQNPVTQTAGTATPRATAVDPATDTTTYVTNADGTINVTTSNAQGEILEASTIPATVAAGGSRSSAAPGALLNLVA